MLLEPPARPGAWAVSFPDGRLTYAELDAAAAQLRARFPAGDAPLALWTAPELSTAISLVAGLGGGRHLVPIDPKSGPAELERIVAVSGAAALLAPPGIAIAGLATISAGDGDPGGAAADRLDEGGLIVFTSGTTGPSKGVVLSAAAIEANLAALAEAWAWSGADVLVHALPLFHVHGLVLATLGTLRLGGEVRHLGGFDPAAIAREFAGDATMLFAVPTMYRRLADAAAEGPAIAQALSSARLLVSGSAALPAAEHARFERLTGQRIVERYGMSETLMIAAVRAGGERRPGHVGLPLDGVSVWIVGEDGAELPADGESIGEVLVQSRSLFDGYLGAEAETRAAFRDGWFATGDLGVLAPDGYLRLVGRRGTDLIKTGGYRVGAGEVESALLEHDCVAEAAVLGLADPELGERIVAWVVVRLDRAAPSERELIDHVATTLTPHKRPREVRFVAELPRNEMGKLRKSLLVRG
ncbi:MAG TPA: AMP-binding protein [Solirubrobacteraceae bacterium]|nr:AMP-binding protein [Solirubrobacteraceae bacterium]